MAGVFAPVPLSNRYAYVGIANPPAIERVDLVAGKVLDTIPLAGGIPWAIAITPNGHTAYVTESRFASSNGPGSNRTDDVVPIDIATDKVGAPIRVGLGPISIAISPDGRTAYVANMGTSHTDRGRMVVADDYTVTPIDTSTNRPGRSIYVGPGPGAVAVSPDGNTLYVALTGTPGTPSYDVVPVDLRTRKIARAIHVGVAPMAIAITPDGKTAYVADTGWPQIKGDTVTPIDIATGRAGNPIRVGDAPFSIAITPDGETAYVVNNNYSRGTRFTVTPIDIASNTPEKPIVVGMGAYFITISPDGHTAYVLNMASFPNVAGNTMTPIDTRTNTTEPAIQVGSDPVSMAFLPSR